MRSQLVCSSITFSGGRGWCMCVGGGRRSVSSSPSLLPPQRARARHVGWREEAEVTLRRRCKWTWAGPYLHGRRAATNPNKQSDSPRAFWGRIDSSRAQWKAGPAAGRGGTVPGAAPGIRPARGRCQSRAAASGARAACWAG